MREIDRADRRLRGWPTASGPGSTWSACRHRRLTGEIDAIEQELLEPIKAQRPRLLEENAADRSLPRS